MKYFAYGSNMLEKRLRIRVPGANFQAIASLTRYRLRFHKRSTDQSGKCNIVNTGCAGNIIYGVVFDVPDDQLASLDAAEGTGHGYHHDRNIAVQLPDGTEMPILAYIADPDAIDDALIPYAWYHRLVIAGAEQHHLPEEYIADLRAVPSLEDPVPNRRTKLEAEAALNQYYANIGI